MNRGRKKKYMNYEYNGLQIYVMNHKLNGNIKTEYCDQSICVNEIAN